MTNFPDSTNENNQTITGNQGQGINQMTGGMAVNRVEQLTIYLSQKPIEETTQAKTPEDIGKNPYQGLKAFRETDGDRFFGRDLQIKDLWEKFQDLHGDRSTIRVLPIYGPSGSGKSSLARAGLIPALGKKPLAGQEKGQVVSLKPNNCPLEALAIILARIATGDDTPVTKTREFKQELLTVNEKQEFDGLRRIANTFPNINSSPLIILVDQFEELYTLCNDEQVRHAFVENLLYAASDPSQKVSVIITMRSDFLGKTQQHPRLNALFSSQGHLVPIMQPEELALAITEPAKQAGHELDQAIVELLIKGSQGQDGALPLLQFALTQIWEGLRNGVQPIETFKKIGGVGGALANEAQQIYYALTPEQQITARCIFLALIQLNDDNKSTRRRAAISELISSQHNEDLIRTVIDRFARPGVWILVTFSSDQQVEMLEVAHEALIQNWQELKDWLKEHREALSKKRKIEQFADEWKINKKSKDYLLQGRMLRDAREFAKAQKDSTEISLSELAKQFINTSRIKQRQGFLKSTSLFAIFPLMGTLVFIYFSLFNLSQFVLRSKECKSNPETRLLLQYLLLVGQQENLEELNLCDEKLSNINLSSTNLFRTDFKFSQLGNANFQKAFLVEANFQGANLYNADFQDTSLRGVIFQDSLLYQTDFREAKGITEDQLRESLLCNTIMPENFNLDRNRDCESLGL